MEGPGVVFRGGPEGDMALALDTPLGLIRVVASKLEDQLANLLRDIGVEQEGSMGVAAALGGISNSIINQGIVVQI
jgi:hypothetical protein